MDILSQTLSLLRELLLCWLLSCFSVALFVCLLIRRILLISPQFSMSCGNKKMANKVIKMLINYFVKMLREYEIVC